MKNRILTLFMAAALGLTVSCKNDKSAEATDAEEVKEASATAAVYTVDASNSKIDWTGSKPTGKHTGTIAIKEGTVTVNGTDLESGKFMIDMNSITVTDLTGEEKQGLEAHLKGTGKPEAEDEFFNVKKFPTATFELTKAVTENGKTNVEGNLTVKGITKNVKFPATVAVNGDTVTIMSDTFAINRTEWNVNYGSKSVFDNLGDKFINDDIELKVSLTAKK